MRNKNKPANETPQEEINPDDFWRQTNPVVESQPHTPKKPDIVHHEEEDDISEFDSWDPLTEDFKSPKNTLALNVDDDPLAQITGRVRPVSSKIGHVSICDHYARYGNCMDGQYCEKIHISPASRDKIWALQNNTELNKNRLCINFTHLSPIELQPDPKVLLLASVTNASSPNLFYFVPPYESMNFSPYNDEDLEFYIERAPRNSSVKAKLQLCHEQLESLFEHSYRIDNLNDDIFLSQVVACKLKDKSYRRAMVLDVPDFSMDKFNYRLHLIDVGIEVELPRESIFDIKATCLSEPPMAVPSRLNIKPIGNSNWSQEALDMFELEARGERFWLCKIINHLVYDNIFTVDLYHPKTRSSLTERLIEAGLAEKCLY